MSGEQGGQGGNDAQPPPSGEQDIVDFMNQMAREREEAEREAASNATISQEPVVASQDENSPSVIQPDATSSSVPHTRADALTVSTEDQPSNPGQDASESADHPPLAPDSTEQPAATENATQQVEVSPEQVEAAVQNGLREFVHHALMTDRRRLQRRHYERTARLATIMGGPAHLRDALVALDDADRNLGNAIQQYRIDATARQQAAQSPPANTGSDPNQHMDRSGASGGPHWKAHKHKLMLVLKMGKRMRGRKYETVDKNSLDVDSPSPKDILRLNKWRNSEILRKAGLPRRPHTGRWWHPAAKRDVLRRYIKNVRGGRPSNYKGIEKAHNKLFEGVFLPREIYEVPKRNDGQIAAICERALKNQGGLGRVRKGNKKREAISRLCEKYLNEEKARAKKSIKEDFSATEEELKEVEDEEQGLQDDTESDNESDGSDDGPLDSDDIEQPEEQEEEEQDGEGEGESEGEVSDVRYQGDGQWDENSNSDYDY